MREFNLEIAKAGAPLCTRKGNKVRIVCYDRLDTRHHGVILALVENKSKTWEMAVNYTNEGRCATALDPDLDLMIDV